MPAGWTPDSEHHPIKRGDDGRIYAGSGQHSHEVPGRDGRVVWVTDGHHEGTEIFWSPLKKVYVSVQWDYSDAERCQTHDRLILVRGADVDECEASLVACDLESPDGLLFLHVEPGEVVDLPAAKGCDVEILWDSDWTKD
jgi:hypothetical protein